VQLPSRIKQRRRLPVGISHSGRLKIPRSTWHSWTPHLMYRMPTKTRLRLARSCSFSQRTLLRDFTRNLEHSKIIIPGRERLNFQAQLDTLGFSRSSMFPEFDGLAQQLSWRYWSMEPRVDACG